MTGTMRISHVSRWIALAVLLGVGLTACENTQAVFPDKQNRSETSPTWGERKRETIFGEGGLFSNDKKKKEEGGGGGIGVNAFLWRATLDTFAFMPLSSADPFGGVIITDWYQPPETPGERFKTNVYILDKTLRADGIRVALFRQTQDRSGSWIDASVDPKTASDLENAILTRARQLRQATMDQ
jgi:hypothetical protein